MGTENIATLSNPYAQATPEEIGQAARALALIALERGALDDLPAVLGMIGYEHSR